MLYFGTGIKNTILLLFCAGIVMSDFRKNKIIDIIEKHNDCRMIHDVPPLFPDEILNKQAQDWADQLANYQPSKKKKQNISLYRSEVDGGYGSGENIYVVTTNNSETSPFELIKQTDITRIWYSEIHYIPKWPCPKLNSEMFRKVAHFTQIIWQSSERMGCGISQNNAGSGFVVCNYDPPGNKMGEEQENVRAPYWIKFKRANSSTAGAFRHESFTTRVKIITLVLSVYILVV